MTAIMTRLPSDSFWPSGALESDTRLPFPAITSESSSSVTSPLALPRGAVGYFDQSAAKGNSNPAASSIRGSRVYSPLSPGARGPALPQLPQFLSPHLAPTGRDTLRQHRSTSLPPTHRDSSSGSARTRSTTTSPPRAGAAPGLMQGSAANAGHPRTTSADSSSAPSQTQMIRRLVQQNGRIREAWEAERKYLEANRERAEEVYKEERALMEEERAEWEDEKVNLLHEIDRLQQHILTLGGDARRPRATSLTGAKNPHVSAHSLRGGAAWEASPESMRSSMSSQGNGQRNVIRSAISLSHLQADIGPPHRALSAMPNALDASSFRSGSGSSTELASVPEADDGPVPIVDVQEIHPELEGIPIKANTIQKATFTDTPSQNGSGSSSRASSPLSGPDRPRVPPQGSKEQTLQVLAAHESVRLTMHAGHTPSHSLSLIPTVASSSAHTASSSGESTPKLQQADGAINMGLASVAEEGPRAPANTSVSLPLATANPDTLAEFHAEPEPMFGPTEDRELRGPLMVRNMPAHDEIFFRRLSDKLEEVCKDDRAALPAVLKDVDQTNDQILEIQQDVASSDGASDTGTEKGRSSPPKSDQKEEFDIPLKFKTSMNFGTPFGTFR
ncbi:hypothetical protein B0H67DRAFT_481484 [Lasiosphaeris hirsuta]|uniref:Uncharacterized protein n=1 Tax=Lasiosphaeris hirsuta TaxID=260670 RepID=A0AA40B150_9PEZI|nr:hypothetical protein B0H67DRAFT_481484 [Lasiosphaeris hirsuta]